MRPSLRGMIDTSGGAKTCSISGPGRCGPDGAHADHLSFHRTSRPPVRFESSTPTLRRSSRRRRRRKTTSPCAHRRRDLPSQPPGSTTQAGDEVHAGMSQCLLRRWPGFKVEAAARAENVRPRRITSCSMRARSSSVRTRAASTGRRLTSFEVRYGAGAAQVGRLVRCAWADYVNSGYMRALATAMANQTPACADRSARIVLQRHGSPSRTAGFSLDDQHTGAVAPQAPRQRQPDDATADDHHVPSLHESIVV